MTSLRDIVHSIRSKNAGPFQLTIDVFCGSQEAFDRTVKSLDTPIVANRLGVPPDALRRFDIAALHVVKLSLPRPAVQGTLADRDMHGASYAELLAEIDMTD